MNYGKNKDYEYPDFGLRSWDQEGLLNYKRKFGTEGKTISFLRYNLNDVQNLRERQMRSLLPR
jgi:hypothetical protein